MFIYFVPGGGIQLPPALAYITESGKTHARDIPKGPSGGPGRLWSSHAFDADRLRYDAMQPWIDAGGYWLCLASAGASPANLAREQLIAGVEVTLGDGNAWRIPIARAWLMDEGHIRWARTLPCGERFHDGQWMLDGVLPKYQSLWDIGSSWFESQCAAAAEISPEEGGMMAFDFQGLRQKAVSVLAVNYRLGPHEISVLKLFDGGGARKVLDAVADWTTFCRLAQELEKKTPE